LVWGLYLFQLLVQERFPYEYKHISVSQ